MKTPIATLFVCLALVVVGCDKGSPEKTDSEAPKEAKKLGELSEIQGDTLLPTTVGTTSVFEVVGTQEPNLSLKVGASKKVEGGTEVKIDVYRGNNLTDSGDWLVSSKGISQLSAGKGIKFNPPQLNLPFPLKEGQKIEWKGTGAFPMAEAGKPATGTLTASYMVRGKEEVDTGLGPIEAIAVQSITIYTSGDRRFRQEAVTWWAPKYGIVRYVQGIMSQKTGEQQVSQQKMVLRLLSVRAGK